MKKIELEQKLAEREQEILNLLDRCEKYESYIKTADKLISSYREIIKETQNTINRRKKRNNIVNFDKIFENYDILEEE